VKLIHWLIVSLFIIAIALLVMGFSTAGWVILAISPVIALIHDAVTGKQTNSGDR